MKYLPRYHSQPLIKETAGSDLTEKFNGRLRRMISLRTDGISIFFLAIFCCFNGVHFADVDVIEDSGTDALTPLFWTFHLSSEAFGVKEYKSSVH